jgi:hypothetical protein
LDGHPPAVIVLSESPGIFPVLYKGEDMKDELEELIDAAHDLYGDYSIYEVMDLSRSPITTNRKP